MLNNAQGPQNYNMANQVQNPNGMYLYKYIIYLINRIFVNCLVPLKNLINSH